MAAAVYTTDLTDVFTDGGTGSWSAIGGGQSGLNQETDYFIQGTSCLSKNAFADSTKGMMYDNTTDITLPTDGAFLIWITHQTANSLDTIANGGLRVILGDDTSNYRNYNIGGSDTIRYDQRWICAVVDDNAASNSQTGAPVSPYSWIGGSAKMIGGPTKGAPFAIDAIRYGRVKLSYTNGDLANGYATFDDAAVWSDNTTRTYGHIQAIGSTYLMRGLHELGTTSTSVDFRDSERTIDWANSNITKVGLTNFHKITINNASSNVDWTNITMTGGDNGATEVYFDVVDNATVDLNTCILNDFSSIILLSNSTFTGCTVRRASGIDLGGGTLTDCNLENFTGTRTVLDGNTNNISGCTFVSDGSNHAVEIDAVGTGSTTWNNNLDGYVAGTAGTNVSTGSTGNEAIYLNFTSSATYTINVSGGDIPSVRKGTGFTGNVDVIQSTTVTLTGLRDNTEVRVMQAGSNTVELAGTENATTGTTDDRSFAFSLSSGTSVDIYIVNTIYENIEIYSYTIPASNQDLPQQQRFDRNYFNP